MKLDPHSAKLMKSITVSIGLSNEQSAIIFDTSLSTWVRIKNDRFNGILTVDQLSRIHYINFFCGLMHKKGFNKNWLFTTGVLKSSPKSPFELISVQGFLGIAIIIQELSGHPLPSPPHLTG